MIRPLTVAFLALWKRLSQKEIGARIGISQKKVSLHLRKEDLDDGVYRRLLAGVRGRPAEVHVVTGCLEALRALDGEGDLTTEERDEVERGVLEGARLLRTALAETARRSRLSPPADRPPRPGDAEPARWHAARQWAVLEKHSEKHQLLLVRVDPEFRTWALAERACEDSVVQASRDLDRAASRARLAREIAGRVDGPEAWRLRLCGFAALHGANVLRVAGELEAAEAAFEHARRLWNQGSDPGEILDPGRPFDLKASLRRAQRRFEDALALLDRALEVGRCPARYLINKGFTLEVMGEYERAVETLLAAEPLVERQADARLRNILKLNLAVNACHLGRFREAGELTQQVRDLAAEMGDEIGVLRATWLEGRIAAGQGRTQEALRWLAQARQEFELRAMGYDVALALLEEAALLLDEGRAPEVKALAQELNKVFKAKGVHREALAALRLFQDAAEREAASAELARRVLGYLFRARYDQGLRFES